MTGRFKPTIGIEWAEPVKREENQVFSHDDFMVRDIEQQKLTKYSGFSPEAHITIKMTEERRLLD